MWLRYYRLPNDLPNTVIITWPPTLDEASNFFQIPKSKIAQWTQPAVTKGIIEQHVCKSSRNTAVIFLFVWLEMERKLFNAFIEHREAENPMRDVWFWRKAILFWKEVYPQLESYLFVFSQGWFRGFLSGQRIVLWFVTNTAQSSPDDYKQQILSWLQFNWRNRIITALVPIQQQSPLLLNIVYYHNEEGITNHQIYNVDETSLSWEYVPGQTYNLKETKTIWSKRVESSSEKRQYTLFLCVFADGVPRIPPILIFSAVTDNNIWKKEAYLWDKQIHVEFTPTD